MKRSVALSFLFVLAIVSGFYQEKLKISINYILEQGIRYSDFYNLAPEQKQDLLERGRIDAPFDYYHNHKTISWLFNFNERELSLLKWVVTAVGLVWFLLLNIMILRLLNVQKEVVRVLPIIYLVLVVLAYSIYALGLVGFNQGHCYAVSRKIIGALQSIIPILIMWPAARLWAHSKMPESL
jgi:hypothetical protein